MGERLLIVTADDLGLSPAVDRGIFEAVRSGVVSAVSALANGPALPLPRAVSTVESLAGCVARGAHLNLTEGEPISPGRAVPSLVRRDGQFHPLPALLLRATLGLIRPEDVTREVAAQVERLRELGWSPTYADSHQHVHVHPRLAAPIARALRSAGLRRVRWPMDTAPGPGVLKALAIAAAARASARPYSGLAWPTVARGIARRPISLARAAAIFASLPWGLAELIVHPRAAGPLDSAESNLPDPAARRAELATLVDPRLPALLERYSVRIVMPGDGSRRPGEPSRERRSC